MKRSEVGRGLGEGQPLVLRQVLPSERAIWHRSMTTSRVQGLQPTRLAIPRPPVEEGKEEQGHVDRHEGDAAERRRGLVEREPVEEVRPLAAEARDADAGRGKFAPGARSVPTSSASSPLVTTPMKASPHESSTNASARRPKGASLRKSHSLDDIGRDHAEADRDDGYDERRQLVADGQDFSSVTVAPCAAASRI